jgi:hypothetical protein
MLELIQNAIKDFWANRTEVERQSFRNQFPVHPMVLLERAINREIVVDFVNTTKEAKWRLRAGDAASEWDSYYVGVHTFTFKNILYGYATQYWDGVLPTETPFIITPVANFKCNEITSLEEAKKFTK